jgi:WD40 repeat protein/transcriptional regulator with XRE-family HTH domain
MACTPAYEPRDHAFGALALMLRERAGLTQQELAALAGVSERAIQKWEAGESYPSAASLKRLIGVYLHQGVFDAGREGEEAAGLWDAIPQHTARHRKVPFDRTWFGSLLTRRPAEVGAAEIPPMVRDSPDPDLDAVWSEEGRRSAAASREDWGEAPDSSLFYGRTDELDRLTHWAVAEHCRVVALLGMGGIGKTALAARLAHTLAPHFACIFWRSLANALPFDEWLGAAVRCLSAQRQTVLPGGVDARLGQLLGLLRERRCLLVLDNWETVLRPGEPVARCREGYEGYGLLLRRLAEVPHQSCLVLTSRESPPELGPLAGARGPVCALRLRGLAGEEGRAMLQDKALAGDLADWQALVARFGGNALALRLVGETIAALFGGELAAFLAEPAAIFGDLRQLLDGQRARLSPLERSFLYWLAIAREPVSVGSLATDVDPAIPRAQVYEGMEALLRRSLVDAGERPGTFTLPPAVQEYLTERLVEEVHGEIASESPALLVSHALVEATARDYVRRSQERLIAAPLLEQLAATNGGAERAESRLRRLLGAWQGRPAAAQGYGPGNVVNLLRLLRGDLRGLDLSRLAIRQAYLQETEAQGVNLTGARLSQSVLAEAFDQIFSVALSADGALLAAGASSGEVCLWRVADRTRVMSVPGHAGITYAVALSADARRLASGGGDGLLKLWDAGSGACVATMPGHIVQGVALSADGRLLASGGEDGTVRLWEAESGACLAVLHGRRGVVHSVALSEDGRLLASGGGDGTVRIWDVETGTCRAVLNGQSTAVHSVALSPDGRLVLSGGADGTLRLWDAGSGRQRATLHGHAGRVVAVAISADGRLLASGGDDGMVRLWEAEGGTCLAALHRHRGPVLGVALSADGQLAASGGSDGAVRLWAARGGECLVTVQGSAGVVWGVALAADGRLIASGGGDGLVRLWDAERGACQAALRGHNGRVHRVVLSAGGQVLASGGDDGAVWLWDVGRRERLAILRGHSGIIHTMAMSADGRLLASAGAEGTTRLWDVPGGACRAVLEAHDGLVYRLALSADGGLLASASLDGTVRLWEGPNWTCRRILRGHLNQVFGVALSADGQLVASSGEDGTVRLWDAASGDCRAVLRGHSGWVAVVALSADGGILASGGIDGSVRLWDVDTGECLASWDGHAGGVWGVACSVDGRLLVTCGADGTVKLWATPSGAVLRTLRPDRLYERMDITGLTGITAAQRDALLALGAVESCIPE